jgi:hypothetical protein
LQVSQELVLAARGAGISVVSASPGVIAPESRIASMTMAQKRVASDSSRPTPTTGDRSGQVPAQPRRQRHRLAAPGRRRDQRHGTGGAAIEQLEQARAHDSPAASLGIAAAARSPVSRSSPMLPIQ